MVYVDALRRHERRNKEGNQWCHMMADTLSELHFFARSIGVAYCWFDGDHYDLNPSQRGYAVRAGASQVSSRDLVAIRRQLRATSFEET